MLSIFHSELRITIKIPVIFLRQFSSYSNLDFSLIKLAKSIRDTGNIIDFINTKFNTNQLALIITCLGVRFGAKCRSAFWKILKLPK